MTNNKRVWRSVFILMHVFVLSVVWLVANHIQTHINVSGVFSNESVIIDKPDLSMLQRYVDELDTDTNETSKTVSGSMLLSGNCKNDLTFTSEGGNVCLTFSSFENFQENSLIIDYCIEYEDGTKEYLQIQCVTTYNEDGVKDVLFEYGGVTYSENQMLEEIMSKDGVTKCFGFFSFLVVAIITISVVTYAIDTFNYLYAEEITVAGVLLIVVEGLLLLPSGGTSAVVCQTLKSAGKSIVKNATTNTGKYIVNENIKTIEEIIAKNGTDIVANSTKKYASHSGLVKFYNKILGKKQILKCII